jgi:hypothetical protein
MRVFEKATRVVGWLAGVPHELSNVDWDPRWYNIKHDEGCRTSFAAVVPKVKHWSVNELWQRLVAASA